MKMSLSYNLSWHQRFKTQKSINTKMLYTFVPTVREYNMTRVKKVEKIAKIRELKKIE